MTRARGVVPPAPLLVIASVVSVQFGGALAATLIPTVGVVGSVGLRLALGAVVLGAVCRPTTRGRTRRDWATVTAYAAALTTMNLCFYGALASLPIGVAVTCEFVGPLTLSAVLSRRWKDAVAVLSAVVGVVLVSGAVTASWSSLDLRGIALALAAGACWAAYIVTSGATGRRFAQLDGLAIALTMGSVLVLPVGAVLAGAALWTPGALGKGAGIALLSSVLPYSMELLALRRMTAKVFGILLSLEPAAAAVAGLLVLGQRLTGIELVGMALVVLASVVVLGSARDAPPEVAGGRPRRLSADR